MVNGERVNPDAWCLAKGENRRFSKMPCILEQQRINSHKFHNTLKKPIPASFVMTIRKNIYQPVKRQPFFDDSRCSVQMDWDRQVSGIPYTRRPNQNTGRGACRNAGTSWSPDSVDTRGIRPLWLGILRFENLGISACLEHTGTSMAKIPGFDMNRGRDGLIPCKPSEPMNSSSLTLQP
jgi:hypothetical protein